MIGPSPWQGGRGKYWFLHTCTHTWSLPARLHGDHNSRRGICLLTYSPCRSYQCAGITDTLFVDYYQLTDITKQKQQMTVLSFFLSFTFSLFLSLSLSLRGTPLLEPWCVLLMRSEHGCLVSLSAAEGVTALWCLYERQNKIAIKHVYSRPREHAGQVTG